MLTKYDFRPLLTRYSENSYPLREMVYADFGLGEQAESTDLYKSATAIVGSGLSALSAIANVIDKPRAAISGALAYLGSGDEEHLKNVLFMLPFSESYLRGTYERVLGTKLPEKHISGREVLTAWGAEPNRQGFHPIRDPRDAVLDALGLAIEVATFPPIGPSVGSLTKKGAETLGKLGATDVGALFRAASEIKAIPEHLAKAARNVKTANDRIQWYASVLKHSGAGDDVIKGFVNAFDGLGDKITSFLPVGEKVSPEFVTTSIRTALNVSEMDKAISGGRIIPRVGVGSKVDEIRSGERALLSLKPTWPLKGDSLVDFTGPVAAKLADSIVHNPLSRFTRHLLDWTTRGMFHKGAAIAAETSTDWAMQIKSATDDIVISTESMLTSVADQYARLSQVGAFAGDVGTSARLDEMMRFVTENVRRGKYSVSDRYSFVLEKLFGTADVSDDKLRFVNDIVDINVNLLSNVVDKIHEAASAIGIPRRTLQDYFAAYFPRYANPSEYIDPEKLASSFSDRFLVPKSVGRLLSTSGKRRMTTARMNALRHIPGGTVAVDWASRHPFLSQVIDGHGSKFDKLISRDSRNTIITYGDYVTNGEVVGRFGGVTAHDRSPKWFVLDDNGKSVLKDVDLSSVRKTSIPRGVDIPILPLRRIEGYDGALQWFRENGIDISKEYGLKGEANRYRAVMSRFLRDAVLGPFSDATNPMTKLLHVLPDEADSVLAEVRREMRSLALHGAIPKVSRRTWKRIEDTVKKDGGLNGALLDYLGKKLPGGIFTNGVLDDFYEYMRASGEMISAVGGAYRGIAMSVFVPTSAKSTAGSIPLSKAFSQLSIPSGRKSMALEMSGLGTILDNISRERPDIIKLVSQKKAQGESIFDVLHIQESNLKVIQEMLNALNPSNEKRMFIEDVVGKFTQMMTSWMTLPRVAFHTRNYVSQVAMGILGDAPYTAAEYITNHKDTFAKLVSGNLSEIKYYDEIVRSDILKKNFYLSQALHETGVKPRAVIRSLSDILTPVKEKSFGEIAKSAAKVWESPWGNTGQSANVILDIGRRVFDFVESATRIPVYQAARDAGLSSAQAQEAVKRLLYDYSRLSPFEQRFLQRGLLFYSWTRNNLPAMFTNTALRWTTGHARLLHAYGRLASATQEDVQLPGWLADTMPVILSKSGPDGKQIVVRQFGLPIQDLALLSPDLANLQARLYAQSHPFIRAAYKLATGRDPYTQIPIQSRKSALERVGVPIPKQFRVAYRISEDFNPLAPLVNQFATAFVENSPPLARLVDALTGIKIGKYDIQKLGYLDITKKLEKYLASRPEAETFSRVYIPEDEKETGLTEKTESAYKLYRGIEKLRREERKKVSEVSEVLDSPLTPLIGGL